MPTEQSDLLNYIRFNDFGGKTWLTFWSNLSFKYRILDRFERETLAGVDNYSRYSNIAFFGLYEGE